MEERELQEQVEQLQDQVDRLESQLGRVIWRMQTLIQTFQALSDEYEREVHNFKSPEMTCYYKGMAGCYSRVAKWLREDLEAIIGVEGREQVGTTG